MKRLKNNNFILKFTESLLGKGLDHIFAALLPFIAVKLFGVTIYGEYTYYLAIAMMLSILTKIGLENSLIYFIPKEGNKFITSSFTIVAFLSILVGAIYQFVEKEFINYLPILTFLSVHTLFASIHRTSGKIKEYFLVSAFIRQGITILLLFIFSSIGIESGILIAYTLGFLFANAFLTLYNRKSFGKFSLSKDFLFYSFPLMITSAMAMIINQIDVIMIRHYIGTTSVGIYNIASKLATLPSIFLVIFNIAFAPKISELYHKGRDEEIIKLYSLSTRILMFSSLLAVVVIFLLNNWLLGFFGEEFLVASGVVLYRGIGQVVNSGVGSVGLMLSMTGKARINMYIQVSAAILNIIINAILIPRYGINGAAIASMIAISYVNVARYIVVSKQFRVRVFKLF